MLDTLADTMIATLLGAMVFFAAVVAPTVFQALPSPQAGTFLRRLFPRYYLFIIITSALAATLLWPQTHWPAKGMLLIAISTLGVRQLLVPRINRWRDQDLGGDRAAGKRFAMAHRASVSINLFQLVLASWIGWVRF